MNKAERVSVKPRRIANAGVSGWVHEDPLAVEDTILAFFLDYWRMKKTEDRLPLHQDFAPSHVRRLLPLVIMADALPDLSDFRYRVIGSKICRYFLADSTGRTVSQAFENYQQLGQETLWLYRRACVRRYPLCLKGPAIHLPGIFFPAYEALYLPYSGDGKAANRVLNVFSLAEH
jgi:hypothetical protein